MDFIGDDGGAGLGYDDADDVIANEEFSSWLNTQMPRPMPPTQHPSQTQSHASPQPGAPPPNLASQLPAHPSPHPDNMLMGQSGKASPAPQVSPKTQSSTPNPYNAWKNSGDPPAAGPNQRQSPLDGTPRGFEGSMHGRTPSVAAGMSRYMAQMPSQRMMQQQQQPPQQGGPQSGMGTPQGLQTPHMLQGTHGPAGPAAGDGPPVPTNQGAGGPQMGMPPGMPPMGGGPMGQMPPQMTQNLPSRMGPSMGRMPPQSMSPGPQRPSMMGAGMPQGVPVVPGTPVGPQGPQGMQGPQSLSGVGAGPMGNMPQGQPQMFGSQPMHGQMMNGNIHDGSMPFPPSMHPPGAQGSPSLGDGAMSPQMGSHMPPNMFRGGPQGRAPSVAGPAGQRRPKKRTASTISNTAGPGPGMPQPPSNGAQSPRPTPASAANFSPNMMGQSMPPVAQPNQMSRPGSRLGSQQNPQQPLAQGQYPLQMQRTGQSIPSGQMMPGASTPIMGHAASRGPSHTPMPPQGMPGQQGPPPQPPAPRTGSAAGLHVYSMPNEVVRLALIALSLYTQVLKYGPHSIAMKEIVRRIDSFPPLEQRRMVEKFEISRGGTVSELARLPIARVLHPIFWRTLAECYSQTGTPPVPQSVPIGNKGSQLSLLSLFQAVQTLGGYIDTTLTGRWPVVLRMLNLPTQGPPTPVELIWVYATTLLTFEVYAIQHEQVRRQLVSQLASPRPPNGAASQPGSGTPTTAPRAASPAAGPGFSAGADVGPAAELRSRVPRAAAAQRMKAPPTQQAPSISQTQARVPQRRAPPGMTQPGMIPASQAMQRNAMLSQRPPSQMGTPTGQTMGSPAMGGGPSSAIGADVPSGASSQMQEMAGGSRGAAINGMVKDGVSGTLPVGSRPPYMGSSVPVNGGTVPTRRANPAAGDIPSTGTALGLQNDTDLSSMANSSRHNGGDLATTMQQPTPGASQHSMHGMLADQMPASMRGAMPNVPYQTAEAAGMNAGAKRAALADEEGRKRSRLGGTRHEQLRRETQGRNTFNVLSEHGKYLLQRRHSSTHGGRNVRFLSALGNEIENWRPEVAFPLDLGIVDLHAVTRSLASQHPAEVRQTLDKLIVVSANPRVHESLQHCPRLLANLCKLVMNMIDQLLAPGDDNKVLHKAVNSSEAEIIEDDAKLLALGSKGFAAMNAVLQKHKRDTEGEVVIEVDSQTGAETGQRSFRGCTEESNGLAHDGSLHSTEDHHQSVPSNSESTTEDKSSTHTEEEEEEEEEEDAEKPFCFPSYGTRYQRVESEICALETPPEEMKGFIKTSLCDRILLATCVLRNLSFSESNRPVIARKPEFLQLLWRLLEVLGTHEKLLDSELRTLDLCKDLLTVLGNIALYVQLPNSRDILKLMLFLLSFAPVESPFTDSGELKLMDYDIDVHRYLPNAIDVFAKIAPRENPNRHMVEEVLLGTCQDPGYKRLIGRWLKAQGRTELYPAELLSRMFALSIAMMPFTHFRPPSRDIDTRQPYLLQATMAAELMVNMIPDDENENGVNIALSWLESVEHFGARMVRTLNFMGMVVVNKPENSEENMRPFAKITQRGVNVVQRLFKKAKRSSEFRGSGIAPTIEHLLGGLMAAKMDKVVVKHLNALYDESTALQQEAENSRKRTASVAQE